MKVNGMVILEMARGTNDTQMATPIEVNTLKVCPTAKAPSHGPMARATKVNGSVARCKAMEPGTHLEGTRILETGGPLERMATECMCGRTGIATKASGGTPNEPRTPTTHASTTKKASFIARVTTSGQTAAPTSASSRTVTSTGMAAGPNTRPSRPTPMRASTIMG